MKKGLMFLLVSAAAMAVVFSGCASTGETAKTDAAAPAATTAAATTAANSVVLWNFESKSTDGFAGKGKWSEACVVNSDPKFVKEGKYSMKIESKGSNGWNQDIAVFDGPFPAEFNKLKAITMDVYVPKETLKGLQYAQIFIVISGSANSWYQVPQGLKEGWNSLEYKIETDNVSGDLWHAYFVFNSNAALGGPVYIDNAVGKF